MTVPKVHSDTDTAALENAVSHTASAMRMAGAIATRDHMTQTEIKALLSSIIYHLAQAQEQHYKMQIIRNRNNPRRRKGGAATDGGGT